MVLPRKFPHMRPAEAELMRKFHLKDILRGTWSYDVKLYPELPLRAKEWSESEKRMWLELHALRIDAVCETIDTIWLIEVKEKLSPIAVGELEIYEPLYLEQYSPTKPVKKMIVTGVDNPLIRPLLKAKGITLHLV